MATVSRSIVLAMDLLRAPVLAETMRRQPLLPSHEILILLRIAGGCPETSRDAVCATGAPLDHLRHAASLYLKRVLLFPGADSYRVLGVTPESPHETVREHLRWMMRWLHPDRNQDSWETVYADRVLSAWDDLKSPARREDYDRRKAADARDDAARRDGMPRKPGIPWIARPVHPRHRRWTDVFRIGRSRQRPITEASREPHRPAGGWRLLAYAPLAGVLAFLAGQVVLSASTADPTGGEAMGIDASWNSEALVGLAESHISNAPYDVDWVEVRRIAKRALSANPLETRALMLLAFAAEAEGDERQAARLVSLAGIRTLRDPASHLWLFGHRLREDDFSAALKHADVILRVHPRLKATLLPYLMAMTDIPAGQASMIEVLETGPPWRGWFMKAFSRQAADPSDPAPIYAALQSGPRPPSSAELRPHLERLVESGRFEQALVVWMKSLAPDQTADLGYLYNGSFAHPITNLPFDWAIGRVRGAEIGIAASPMGDGKALRVQFGRARVPFRHVRKLMVLPPGSYELSGSAMAVDFSNERGLRWTIACAEAEREVLVSTARITGTARTEIAKPFSVPANGCRAQWLRLELAARIAPEQDVDGGSVWYDSLQIRRTGALNPS
ncbi:MAG: DnaJ domain-containing protein [bacterium]